MNERDVPEPTADELLDADDGYREWSETIEAQNLEQQIADEAGDERPITVEEYEAANVIDLSDLSWSQIHDQFCRRNSAFHKALGLIDDE